MATATNSSHLSFYRPLVANGDKTPVAMRQAPRKQRGKQSAAKCENCRMRKKKCIPCRPESAECQQCSERNLSCPGFTTSRRRLRSKDLERDKSKDRFKQLEQSRSDHDLRTELVAKEVEGLAFGMNLLYDMEGDDDSDTEEGVDDDDNAASLSSSDTPQEIRYSLNEDLIWADLRDQYRQTFGRDSDKPSSFAAFLKNLQSSGAGIIRCRSCWGQKDGDFLAGVNSMLDHYVWHHLGNLRFVDKTDGKILISKAVGSLMRGPLEQASISRLLAQSWDQSKDHPMVRHFINNGNERVGGKNKKVSRLYEKNRRMPQWAVLRQLKKKFIDQHRSFLRYAMDLRHPEDPSAPHPIRRFAKRCKRSRDVLHLGVLTFKKVLRGKDPTTLREVFAFMSLSYAMANVMADQDIKPEFTPNVADIYAWAQTIQNESQRAMLQQLVSSWFSDLDPGLTSRPVPPSTHPSLSSEFVAGMGNFGDDDLRRQLLCMSERISPSDDLPLKSMRDAILQLLKTTSSNPNFNFSAFLRLPGIVTSEHQGPQALYRQSTSFETDNIVEDETPPREDSSIHLWETAMFIRAQYFMIYVSRYGILLIYFGDPSRSFKVSLPNTCTVTIEEIVETVEKLKATIIDTVLGDGSCPTVRKTIYEATREILDTGVILNEQDLRRHLEAVETMVESVLSFGKKSSPM